VVYAKLTRCSNVLVSEYVSICCVLESKSDVAGGSVPSRCAAEDSGNIVFFSRPSSFSSSANLKASVCFNEDNTSFLVVSYNIILARKESYFLVSKPQRT
jgi:hypothetical protein